MLKIQNIDIKNTVTARGTGSIQRICFPNSGDQHRLPLDQQLFAQFKEIDLRFYRFIIIVVHN